MKRAKLGDVYYVIVPNGYKIYQWAYSIPHDGDYIRVFDGLYDKVPECIEKIVSGPHSYIIPFQTKRAYKIGMSILIGNYPIPEKYPFPDYMVDFYIDNNTQKVTDIEVMSTGDELDDGDCFEVSKMEELPEKYQNITLLNSCIGPEWLLYLFDVNFNLSEPEKFSPGFNHEEALQKYTKIVDSLKSKQK